MLQHSWVNLAGEITVGSRPGGGVGGGGGGLSRQTHPLWPPEIGFMVPA